MSLIWATAGVVWILIGLSVFGLAVESNIGSHWWTLPTIGVWTIVFGGGAGVFVWLAIDR